jgi:uncharacterized protein (DUF433 family)
MTALPALRLDGSLPLVELSEVEPEHIDESGSRPVVAGTNIKVAQIASETEHLGMTPDDIIEAHPHLTLADVHAALAYYYDHQDAIQRDWREAGGVIDTLRARYSSRPPPPPVRR